MSTQLRIEAPDGTVRILEGEEAAERLRPLPLNWDAFFADVPFIDEEGNSLTLITQ